VGSSSCAAASSTGQRGAIGALNATEGGALSSDIDWLLSRNTLAYVGEAAMVRADESQLALECSRAGGRPGALVARWVEDLAIDGAAGREPAVACGVEDHENTCRPDAPVCSGCEHDGGRHTPPWHHVSSRLILHR
jgi:hypothetical protein